MSMSMSLTDPEAQLFSVLYLRVLFRVKANKSASFPPFPNPFIHPESSDGRSCKPNPRCSLENLASAHARDVRTKISIGERGKVDRRIGHSEEVGTDRHVHAKKKV